MEFFYDDYSPHKEFFRKMDEILPLYKEKPDIGLPTQIDKKQLTQFQELFERKRIKGLAEGTPKYKYMFETVHNCMKSVQVGATKTPYQTDNVNFPGGLLQQERDLYYPDQKFLKMQFLWSQKKVKAIKALCTGYVHFTWFDKDEF